MEEDHEDDVYEDEVFEDLDIDDIIADAPRVFTAEVSNISFSMSRDSVGDFFSDLGCKIASLDYSIVEHGKRNKTALAVIEFEDQQSLDVCLSANGFELFGRHIKVTPWQPPLPPSEQPSMEVEIPEDTPAPILLKGLLETEEAKEVVPKVLARRNKHQSAEVEEKEPIAEKSRPKPATEVIPLSVPVQNRAPFGGHIPTASAPARREAEVRRSDDDDTTRQQSSISSSSDRVSNINKPEDIVKPLQIQTEEAPVKSEEVPVRSPIKPISASFSGRPLVLESKSLAHSHSESSLLSARSTQSNTSSTTGTPRSLISVERSREFLALMMKNVSREDPLTDSEIEVSLCHLLLNGFDGNFVGSPLKSFVPCCLMSSGNSG